ncbi:hypothetical protein A3E13_03000 [Candidatus Woesebacteria bacterium RIFCSPHIGHO2_12_FULL_40_20]|nr:MAG: hypothetical protein A2692_03620 [Candidatus Woesebacteria bacterium RIFCSPHIGHO2_01_FULL_39_95]OGM37174.1 MAG: hypothetical protein A3E13_03000 [Candidatus Woesebacteria bacterium RIFCSPHIGHO2_12_FULL_40_20]OGM72123.1 MAG: hypothetical protein A3H19_06570 [Candidatus Woesebacteria bacterium RIFCSPLOWO2_12_FULL_39_9]
MSSFSQFVPDVIKFLISLIKSVIRWYQFTRPSKKLLGKLVDNKNLVRIFVKDFIVENNTINSPKLFSQEGPTTQAHPNIEKVWAEAESRGIAFLLNLFGELGKRDKLEIVEMSRGYDIWDTDMIILGAQAMKCMDFYEVMEDVAYSMDEQHIYNKESGEIIPREEPEKYGYGLILKAKNPQMSKRGIGILLGGFGVLGTQAAIYYFIKNIANLGKEFSNKSFGLIVRAKVSAGEQSVKRLKNYDRVFDN